MKIKLHVIDFFCGAGGFSEGFRQQGFQIEMGIDNWRPAVETHNLNHSLSDSVGDVLDFEKNIEAIYRLPNTEIIIGSPPCVNFSMSNRAGKADKSLGVRLIEAYLRVIAVKKHQRGSILQAWLMENVPNSRNFVKEVYTFEDLDLGDWAISIKKKPSDIALKAKNNGELLIAADYGSPQSRQRFVCGEIILSGEFPKPIKTHGKTTEILNPKDHLTLGDIKQKMPKPIDFDDEMEWADPNYPGLKVKGMQLTDHFYDTGVYQVEWALAKAAKVNHPYMGRMSFPEDENKPSRTIMATRSASTREAIIFQSELGRKGNGEYRLPTIREAATLMGFPYTYQFLGGEGTKWRLIGNAVCPHMASALAKVILSHLGGEPIDDSQIDFSTQKEHFAKVNDLNAPGEKLLLNKPPKKKKGAKFRMHPIKVGNMTVALTNYDPSVGNDASTNGAKWYCTIFLGSGKDYSTVPVTDGIYNAAKKNILQIPNNPDFFEKFEKEFDGKIAKGKKLQRILEENVTNDGELDSPILLINRVANLINILDPKRLTINNVKLDGINKDQIPLSQLYAIVSLSIMEKMINDSN